MPSPFLYLFSKFAAFLLAVSQLLSGVQNISELVMLSLVLCCFFIADILLASFTKRRIPVTLLRIAAVFVSVSMGMEFLPLAVISAVQIVDGVAEESVFWQIFAVCTLLFALLTQPGMEMLFLSLALFLMFAVVRYLSNKLAHQISRSTQQSAELAAQRQKISNMKEYAKSVRSTAALEERNRFAARIHDQLGHGISGSIILLEGAKYSIKTNPERAETVIESVVENLRSSVDKIRAALHEERPNRAGLGLSELKTMLEQFTAFYGIDTDLQVKGDMEEITAQLWICIKDNLTETMTNTLKHSKATSFTLSIQRYNRILRVEYRDNGACGDIVKKGLGLEAIEDRTAANGGHTLLRSSISGFSVTTIFAI